VGAGSETAFIMLILDELIDHIVIAIFTSRLAWPSGSPYHFRKRL